MPKQRLPKHILKPFLNLSSLNHEVTSPADARYNCAAWAAEDTARWWDHFQYWPSEAQRTDDLSAACAAFASLGYAPCTDGRREGGFEKVAIYVNGDRWKHVARQLADVQWTSKLGQAHDICHKTVSALFCEVYGRSVVYMKRPTRK